MVSLWRVWNGETGGRGGRSSLGRGHGRSGSVGEDHSQGGSMKPEPPARDMRGGSHHLQGDVLPGEDGEGAELAHAQADERAAQHAAVDVLHLRRGGPKRVSAGAGRAEMVERCAWVKGLPWKTAGKRGCRFLSKARTCERGAGDRFWRAAAKRNCDDAGTRGRHRP